MKLIGNRETKDGNKSLNELIKNFNMKLSDPVKIFEDNTRVINIAKYVGLPSLVCAWVRM